MGRILRGVGDAAPYEPFVGADARIGHYPKYTTPCPKMGPHKRYYQYGIRKF